MLALAAVYVAFGTTAVVAAVFAGLAPAVVAIVAQAVVRVGRRAARHPALVGIAVAAFVAIAILGVPFPAVIAGAAALGWALGRVAPHALATGTSTDGGAAVIHDDDVHIEAPAPRRAVRVLLLGVLLWAVPVVGIVALTGTDSTLTTQGLFFSGTALVSFGGAYAVLTFVAQRAVEVYGWLSPADMVRGLALAETTPGPLIMVVQFVAFLGAYQAPGSLSPWTAAVLGALLTTWVTFVPCFVFIFVGAPYVERLRGNRALSAALTGVTAAVVGVIANLALYFALHTLFARVTEHSLAVVHLDLPVWSSIRPVSLAIALAAFGMVFVLRWSVLRTLGVCALLGLASLLL